MSHFQTLYKMSHCIVYLILLISQWAGGEEGEQSWVRDVHEELGRGMGKLRQEGVRWGREGSGGVGTGQVGEGGRWVWNQGVGAERRRVRELGQEEGKFG